MGKFRIKATKARGEGEKVKIGAAARRDPNLTWVDDPSLLVSTARRFEREHAPRVNENRRYQRLYYQKPFVTAPEMAQEDGVVVYDVLRRHGANLTAEVIDAGIALLCRRLKPKVSPVGGDYAHQTACTRLERVIDGVAEAGKWLSVFTEVARAGMYGDVGFALIDVDEKDNRCKAWKLDQNYVFWPLDATTVPRQLVIVMPVPKRTLKARYALTEDGKRDLAMEKKIDALPTWRPKRVVGVDDIGAGAEVDTVALVIGWCLPEGPNMPGKKTVAAGDLVFSDDPYELDVHQVVKYSWKPNANGFAGVPLTRTLAPWDLTNKQILKRTLNALDGAVPWLLHEEENDIEAVSDVEFQHVTFPRGGVAPTVVVPNPVSTQALDRLEDNRSSAFREAHINENAAQGQAPNGIKSAVAQFAWADAVQTVLLPQQEAWQEMWKDAAYIVTALMATNKKARVRVGEILEEVDIPDLDRSKYEISFGLISGLALTVSGRLEQLTQIQAALPNKLDNEDVLRHIGLTDTKQIADRLLAPRELAEYIVQQALEHGEMITPPRAMGPDGLAALYRIASQEYCGALKKPRNYYPRKHLEVLRRVMAAAAWLQKAPNAATAMAAPAPILPLPTVPMGPGAQPVGGPGMPPPGVPAAQPLAA